jgi:hypothetical protein
MKQLNFMILLLITVFLFGGCITNKPIIFDETLSTDDVTTVYWCGTGNYVHPISYNGINVDWNIGSTGYYPIVIPAGQTTFELEGYTAYRMTNPITRLSYTTTWNYTGLSFSYNFAKGESYTVYFEGGSLTIHSGKSFSEDTLLQRIDIDWNSR